jgi:hypothetical protein
MSVMSPTPSISIFILLSFLIGLARSAEPAPGDGLAASFRYPAAAGLAEYACESHSGEPAPVRFQVRKALPQEQIARFLTLVAEVGHY